MSELLDLLDRGPMIALAIAMVLMVVVVVVIILQTRRINRLEAQLVERGEAAEDAPLRRLAELQARHEGSAPLGSGLRPLLLGGAAVVVLALAVGGVWFLLGGDDGPAGGGGETTARTEGQTTSTAGRTTTTDPVSASAVPAEVPRLPDTSRYSIKVLNASGIAGAAGDGVAPRLQAEGFTMLQPDNYTGGEGNLAQSVVMYNGRENQRAAWVVADVLGLDKAPPLDGVTSEDADGADVVVVVGLDLAEAMVSSATP